MQVKKTMERKQARNELEQNIHLVKAPTAMAKDPSLKLPERIKVRVTEASQPMEEWSIHIFVNTWP